METDRTSDGGAVSRPILATHSYTIAVRKAYDGLTRMLEAAAEASLHETKAATDRDARTGAFPYNP